MPKEIKKYDFKPSVKPQLEVISLQKLVAEHKQELVKPHRTDFYHVFLFNNCSPIHLIDFNPIQIQPFTPLFINKNRIHRFDPSLKYEGYLLVFTDNFFCTNSSDFNYLQSTVLFSDFTDNQGFQIGNKIFKQLYNICNAINTELTLPADKTQHAILKNLLHNFLLISEREKLKHNFVELKIGADFDQALRFKELLEKNFKKLKNVEEYAKKLNISEKRLRKAILNTMDKAPKKLIDERILLEAKRLLAYDNKPIKEICFELGFEEPTNFIKYFRKHTGKTPSEFREEFIQL